MYEFIVQLYSAVSFVVSWEGPSQKNGDRYLLPEESAFNTCAPLSNVNLANRNGNGVHPRNNNDAFKLRDSIFFFALQPRFSPFSNCVRVARAYPSWNEFKFRTWKYLLFLEVAAYLSFVRSFLGRTPRWLSVFLTRALTTILKYPKRVSLLYRGVCVGFAKRKNTISSMKERTQ